MKLLLGFAVLAAVTAAAVPCTAKANPPVQVTACGPASNLIGFDSVGFHPQAWTWAMGGPEDGPYYTIMDPIDSFGPSMMPDHPALAVDYINQTTSVIRSIEFGLMARGRLIAEVRDVGMFSPATEISHDFRLPNLWIASGLTCVPLSVTFSNGTIWNSPGHP
ncbi:MAG TPA: hypothetical protein VFW34_02605 [Candidatus Rubrimentiphilum sp.]|nr:hypothetical protein [Candidatus Rubrimentiphilum sp.]